MQHNAAFTPPRTRQESLANSMMTKVEKDAAFTIVCILFQVVCALSVTGDYFNGSGMKICEVEW